MARPIAAALCLAVVLCLLGGCSDPVGITDVYEDLKLTLPGDFINLSEESFAGDADFLYGKDTLIVMGLAEKKAGLKKMTLEEYTAYVVSANKRHSTPEAFGDGYVFSYEATVVDTPYTYTVATYEGEVNFWILQFYCPSHKLSVNQPEIDIILESIQPNGK